MSSQHVLRSLRCRLQVCLITDKLNLLVDWVAFQLLHASFNGCFYSVSFLLFLQELRQLRYLVVSLHIFIEPWEWRLEFHYYTLGYVHVKFCCFQLGVCFGIITSYLSAHEGLELHMLHENCVCLVFYWPSWFLNQVNSSWVTHLCFLNLSLLLIIHDYVVLTVSFSHWQLWFLLLFLVNSFSCWWSFLFFFWSEQDPESQLHLRLCFHLRQLISLAMLVRNQILCHLLEEQIVIDDQLLLAMSRTFSQPILLLHQLNPVYDLQPLHRLLIHMASPFLLSLQNDHFHSLILLSIW